MFNLKWKLLPILITSFFNTAYAQSIKIDLSVKNESLKQLIKQIETKTDYTFMLDQTVDQSQKVTVDARQESLDAILRKAFAGKPITYEIIGKQIILKFPSAKQSDQSRKIRGTVKDQNGEPVIGANVSVKGTTVGTITDVDGNFMLEVPEDAVILISYIGYVPQEVKSGNKSVLNLVLKEDSQSLDEVVVVGYGTQKKINLTGSVASISGDEMIKRPVANASAMLQGLMPGVGVVQKNGQPGAGNIDVQIRGMGTFSGAGVNPLILIDGIEGNMNDLEPNTIQSVSVLKDAASASIYGSRAANGVILVTTKDGSNTGGKLTVSYNFNYGIQKPTKMLDVVSNSADYMEAWNTYVRNYNYGVDIPARQYSKEDIEKYRNGTDPVLYPNFNWSDFIINSAPMQSHNINVSGGDKTRYNLSLGYLNQEGTMEAFYYKRYNAALNVVSDVNSRLKLGVNVKLKKGLTGAPIGGSVDYFMNTLAQAPTFGPTLPDGSGRYSKSAYPFEDMRANPYYVLKEKKSKTDDYNAMAQAWFDYKILDGLHWYVKGAIDYTTSTGTSFVSENARYLYFYHSGEPVNVASSELNKSKEETFYKNLHTYLNYDKRLGVHSIGAMFGYNAEDNNYNTLSGRRRGYVSPFTPELNAGESDGQTNGGYSNAWAMQSLFGRLTYGFMDKYLLEFNMRYDGTSRLAPETRWGFFPSFSAAWRITEEKFMESTKSWLTNLKLRGSWGKLGNQNIGLYPYQALLKLGYTYAFDGENLSQGVAQTALNNYNIKWETTTTTNLGLDVSFFDKLSLTLDVYKKKTSDILRKAQVNSLVGLDAPTINNGAMQNTGYDLEVRWQDRVESGILKDLNYSVAFVASGFKNKLVQFGAWEDDSYVMREEGRPWNTFYLLQVDGIFQTEEEVANSPKQFGENTKPGMLKFKDVNGDHVINNDDRVPIEEGVFPKCTYSFNLNAEYKGFDMYAFFQGVAGSKTYISGWAFGLQPFQNGCTPTKKQMEEAWTPENRSNTMPMIGDPVSFNHPSTYTLFNNSYLRLKTFQIGYSLPKNLINKVGLNRFRVYFSGDNLLTFTKYEGMDPEKAVGEGVYIQYPQNKVISFGCNVEF